MAEKNPNLWAPWRIEYIESLGDENDDSECFLCRYWRETDNDEQHRLVWRGRRAFVVMNRFPYTNGHLLICPADHVGDLSELPETSSTEVARMTRDALRLLTDTIHPHGFNVGMNIGRCAGAGLPDHLHTHIVPRWNGDTNYMAIVGDVRVIPQALDTLRDRLVAGAIKMGLRE